MFKGYTVPEVDNWRLSLLEKLLNPRRVMATCDPHTIPTQISQIFLHLNIMNCSCGYMIGTKLYIGKHKVVHVLWGTLYNDNLINHDGTWCVFMIILEFSDFSPSTMSDLPHLPAEMILKIILSLDYNELVVFARFANSMVSFANYLCSLGYRTVHIQRWLKSALPPRGSWWGEKNWPAALGLKLTIDIGFWIMK